MADSAPSLASVVSGRLAGLAEVEQGPRPSDLTAWLYLPEHVSAVVSELTAAGLGLAMLVATDETTTPEANLKLRYVFEPAIGFAPPLPDMYVTLVVALDRHQPEVASITGQVPAANWHEREARDLFGIEFVGHPDPRPLVVHDGWPKGVYPMRKTFDGNQRVPVERSDEFPHLLVEGEGVHEVPVGPIHAGIIEPGHFRFSTVGDLVLNLDPRLFYTHRGLEKRIEGMPLADACYVAERICGVCSLSHGLGFCEAAEQLAGVEVPRRARALRTIALELERLYNHVGDIGNIAAGASYHYGNSAGLRMKEALQQLNEQLTGHRFLRGLVVPGGVRLDLTAELARSIETTLATTAEALGSLMHEIANNPAVIDRLDTTGLLSSKDATALGVTGVAARASGVDRDARRDHPHAAYSGERATAVSTASELGGDVRARVNVRAAEAHESIRLIRALLADMPPGPLQTTLPAVPPPWAIGLAAIESPRGAALHWLRCDANGRVERYHLRSPSYANWPAVAIAAVTAIVPDFPLVNKSFELCYSCTDR